MNQYTSIGAEPASTHATGRARTFGALGILGGALFAAGFAIPESLYGGGETVAAALGLAILAGLALMALSLVGVHDRFEGRYGAAGRVGAAVTGLGIVGALVGLLGGGLGVGVGAVWMPALLLAHLGLSVLGIGLLRAGVSRAIALVVALAPVLFVVALFATAFVAVDLAAAAFSVPLAVSWVALCTPLVARPSDRTAGTPTV